MDSRQLIAIGLRLPGLDVQECVVERPCLSFAIFLNSRSVSGSQFIAAEFLREKWLPSRLIGMSQC